MQPHDATTDSSAAAKSDLERLTLVSPLLDELPVDPIEGPRLRQVHEACHSRVMPTPVAAPRLLAYSREALALLGLPEATARDPRFAEVFAGNALLDGMQPYAACYGGHQFGNWAGQLGDGRAIALGVVEGAHGRCWELQLKGAGPTPYSRNADGRAVLRSSLREFVCSEAMHHLGVPTTRALSLVASGESVLRDMFYDGHAKEEPGAIVCRMAPSFLRFGNYQIFAARADKQRLTQLLDYTLRHHYPEIEEKGSEGYVALYRAVCSKTAALVAHWMRVGFVHGVMNTDNMSVVGLTIDYGPYGFLDDYNPAFTPNTTDGHGRRYCYGRQPSIAGWNLARFGEALLPVLPDATPIQEALDSFVSSMERALRDTHLQKLGLQHSQPGDDSLLANLTSLLERTETDMTIFYRKLAQVGQVGGDTQAHPWELPDEALVAPLRAAYYAEGELPVDVVRDTANFLRRYLRRAQEDGCANERALRMNRINPKFIFRNYLAQQAIDAVEAGDAAMLSELLDTLRHPYDEQPEREAFAERRPDWARQRPGCSMLSCSS